MKISLCVPPIKRQKRFGTDVIIAVTISYFGYFASFITSVFIARILGPQGKGLYSLFIETIFGIVLFSSFGLGIGQIFWAMKNSNWQRFFLSNGLFFSFTVSFSIAILYYSFGWILGFSIVLALSPLQIFISVICVPVITFIIFQRQYLLVQRSYKMAKWNGSLVTIIPLTFYVLLYIFSDITFSKVVVVFLLGQLLCLILFLIYMKRKYVIKWKLSFQFAKASIFFGLWQYLGDLSFFLIRRLDFFLVFFLLGKFELGIYSVAVAVAEIITRITHELGTILFPEFASGRLSDGRGASILRKTVFMMTIIALILGAAGTIFIPIIFGDAFYQAIIPFQILLIGTLGLSAIDVTWSYALGMGKPFIGVPIFWGGALIDAIFNLLFTPRFGLIGASFAATISYIFSSTILVYYFCKKERISVKKALIVNRRDVIEIIDVIKQSLSKLLTRYDS